MGKQEVDSRTNGVQRYPENGVKVVIIGAGIAGLQAALECWRKGCEVVVLERAQEMSPIGDYFTITPSALTTLKDFPSMHKDYHSCVYDCTTHVYTPSGVEILKTKPEWKRFAGKTAAPDVDISFLKRRPVYAKMQLDQVHRLGIPVHWGDKVVSVVEMADGVAVMTESGQVYNGDLCIGASGIGSSIYGFQAGDEVAVQDSGYAVARVAFPASSIKSGSPASSLLENVETQPSFRVYVGKDIHLILFLTANWVAFAFTHPDNYGAKESWSDGLDAEQLIPYLQKSSDAWDPAVLDFVQSAPDKVVDWKLRWRDSTPNWTSKGGRLIRIGDAAHAFFPTAGNGAVQGLEDAVSLSECLRIGGKKGVAWSTKVHNKLRFERVSILQQTGFLNREELHTADIDAIQKDPKNTTIGFFKIGRWVWNHNPEIYAREQYEACLAHLKDGKPFKNTNVPPGHVYKPWTLASEMERMKAGIRSDLKQNGDWSA